MKQGQIKLVLTSLCGRVGLQVPPQEPLFYPGEMLLEIKRERPVQSSTC